VLRSIDTVEFVTVGSLIDVVNRAEQRGIINSVSEIRILKDLRNEIAHEYETGNLRELFDTVLQNTPQLLAISEQVINYCEKYKTQKLQEEKSENENR
jgi:uncharacterized protein YutE (UPF0331/DUF86 family)